MIVAQANIHLWMVSLDWVMTFCIGQSYFVPYVYIAQSAGWLYFVQIMSLYIVRWILLDPINQKSKGIKWGSLSESVN